MNQELIDKIALLKEELRDLVDNAEVQERSLNDDEKINFESKENEIKQLELQLENTKTRSIETDAQTENKDTNTNKLKRSSCCERSDQFEDRVVRSAIYLWGLTPF